MRHSGQRAPPRRCHRSATAMVLRSLDEIRPLRRSETREARVQGGKVDVQFVGHDVRVQGPRQRLPQGHPEGSAGAAIDDTSRSSRGRSHRGNGPRSACPSSWVRTQRSSGPIRGGRVEDDDVAPEVRQAHGGPASRPSRRASWADGRESPKDRTCPSGRHGAPTSHMAATHVVRRRRSAGPGWDFIPLLTFTLR